MNEYIKEIEEIATKCSYSQSDGYAQIMRICEAIKEQHNDWIPCSERLPEEANDYLVTQYTKKSIFDYCDAYRVSTIFFDNKNGWWDDIDNSCGWDIIAWQPLPAPYKEGVTENE